MTDKPKRRWYQYSLRSMFVLTTLVAMACSWYAYEMKQAAERRAMIEAIIEAGGGVKYYDADNSYTDGEPPGWFSWLRKLHGDEHLGNAVTVYFYNTIHLEHIEDLTSLESLWLGGTFVKDAEMVHLKGLANLEELWLYYTDITDAGLVHLKDLTNLTCLRLSGTDIGNEGLRHLKGLTSLTCPELGNTDITDKGLAHLKDMEDLKELELSYTKVSDVGLVHLHGLTRLRTLEVNDTCVTDDGLKELRKALPNCEINPQPVFLME